MKIIVPMAGRGSRLRPHSLTVPKPLIPVAGQPIVHRLVKDIAKVLKQPIDEIAFVLGDPAFFGDDVVDSLKALANNLGAKASIYRQDQPLGTGHAIMCAKDSLSGPAVIAYADTLIRANFSLDPEADAVIWVKQVDKPEAFGVVKLNSKQEINTSFTANKLLQIGWADNNKNLVLLMIPNSKVSAEPTDDQNTILAVFDLQIKKTVKIFDDDVVKHFALIGDFLIFDRGIGRDSNIELFNLSSLKHYKSIKVTGGCSLRKISG